MFEPRIGRIFGRLTVTELSSPGRGNIKARYLCACICGGTKIIGWGNLKDGTKSCGCIQAEIRARPKAPRKPHTWVKPEFYDTWKEMLRRCSDPKRPKYKTYGAKGVTVCQRWVDSREAFVADMGPKPTPGHTLDRIDPFGNYEPTNCRWADRYTQAGNKRGGSNVYVVEIRGKRAFATEWARKLGASASNITRDIRKGIRPDVAVISAVLRRKLWEKYDGKVPNGEYEACRAKAEDMLTI